MANANVWLRDLTDRLVCADQVTGMYVDRIPGLGWTVIASTRQYGDVQLADFGRGGRARTGADHLCSRLPAAIAAAAQEAAPAAYVITYVPGTAKGAGEWATTRESGPADAAPIVNATRGPAPRPATEPPAAAPRTQPRSRPSGRAPHREGLGPARDWPMPWDLGERS